MKLARSITDRDAAREYAERVIAELLREHAANLIRVARGAGRPQDIIWKTQLLAAAFEEYERREGRAVPFNLLSLALNIEREVANAPDWERRDAHEEIVRGALQISASRLMNQRTQEAAGRHELYGGLNRIIAYREKERRSR